MPFELGLAAALACAEDATHQWRVLESVRYRLNQSLSDVDGYDHFVHGGTIAGTMDVLLDIFGNAKGLPLSEVEDLMWVYRRVREFRATFASSVYRPNAFKTRVVAARFFAEERLATREAGK